MATMDILSSNGRHYYQVDTAAGTCTCLGFRFRRSCRHLREALGEEPRATVRKIQSGFDNPQPTFKPLPHRSEVKGLTDDQISNILYTIGHGRRSFEEFVGFLRYQGINQLVDIRSRPQSRFSPHFNKKRLDAALADEGITYTHIVALGASNLGTDDDRHDLLNDRESGLIQLVGLLADQPVAIMCAESDHRHCHRLYVAECIVNWYPDVTINHLGTK